MLRIFTSLHGVSYRELMDVYEESILHSGKNLLPRGDANAQRLEGEQSLYDYMENVFFSADEAILALWEENGSYCCALRAEPFEDGFLINALETRPDRRQKGYAKALLTRVVSYLKEKSEKPVYSHIHMDNKASRCLHEGVGFVAHPEKVTILLDGSKAPDCITYVI